MLLSQPLEMFCTYSTHTKQTHTHEWRGECCDKAEAEASGMRLPPRGGAVCDGRVTDLHVEALNGSRRLRAGTRLRIGASAGAAREIEVASERGGSRAMARHM